VENGGNVSKGMRDAGYSKATAKNPKKVTDSNNWEDLMEKYLPDNLLAKSHKKLLDKKEVILKNNNKTGKIEVVQTKEIDVQAVRAGLDMAYKLKNKYAATKIKFEDENKDITDEELDNERDRLEAEMYRRKQSTEKKTKSA